MDLIVFCQIVAILAAAGPCVGMGLCEFEKLSGKASESCYGNKEKIRYSCPRGMLPGNCSTQATCDDPHLEFGGQHKTCLMTNACVCHWGLLFRDGACVRPEECPCYSNEYGLIIPANQSYVNDLCTSKVSCLNNQLTREGHSCHTTAQCEVDENSAGKCVCFDGYRGDGIDRCVRNTDCYDTYSGGVREDGVYLIKPEGYSGGFFEVYCRMSEGGWTVFQRRVDGSTDFFRDWESYKNGFGDLDREFWLGNEKIHAITEQIDYELRINMTRTSNVAVYANFDQFNIGPENDNYRLTSLGTYSGTADHGDTGGSALVRHLGWPFSTKDMDNDGRDGIDCAAVMHGGWWYGLGN